MLRSLGKLFHRKPSAVRRGPLLIAVLFTVHCSLFTVSVASAQATISLSPSSGSYAAGKTFTVTVTVDSSQTFNSGNAMIAFDKELLSVQNVSKNDSAFTLWAVEPASSNSAGTVNFEGGNASPLTGKKNILAITFKALKEGTANVSFTAASILAADGKGTDIAGEKKSASYTITAAAATPPPPPPPPAASTAEDVSSGGEKPELPEIRSSTHPDENKYGNAAKAKLNWELPDDVTADRLSFDDKVDTVPTTNYDPAIGEKEFDVGSDGAMYFHLRYKNDAGWGPTAHRKVLIDRTPPEKFTVEAIVDPAKEKVVVLKFNATDTLSGMERYEVQVNGDAPIKVSLIEAKAEGYELSDQTPGEQTIKVTAFDKAGNTTVAETKATIPGEIPKAAGTAAEETEKPTDWRLFGDIGLIAVIAFLIGYLFYERNAFRHEKFMIKREADESRDANANIFAALREEVGEQVGYLFQKPNPSAQDREVTLRINEALDLSEEMIAKEIEDVRKLLM